METDCYPLTTTTLVGQVLVVVLKLTAHCKQLPEDSGHNLFQGGQVRAMRFPRSDGKLLRRSDACNNIFTLSIHQELSIELVLASGGIASEGHSGCTVIAHIPEDHRLHVHSRAPPLRNVMELPHKDENRNPLRFMSVYSQNA